MHWACEYFTDGCGSFGECLQIMCSDHYVFRHAIQTQNIVFVCFLAVVFFFFSPQIGSVKNDLPVSKCIATWN